MGRLRVSGFVQESIVDGPGLRFVIFAQGCNHFCRGCHNPQTFDLNGGYEVEIDYIIEQIKKNPLLRGVTFSGGEPFLQPLQFIEIAKKVHELGLDVVSFTGYTFEELTQANAKDKWKELLYNIDILIDGPFILEKKNMMIKFRGSENQRILDVKSSLETGNIVEITF